MRTPFTTKQIFIILLVALTQFANTHKIQPNLIYTVEPKNQNLFFNAPHFFQQQYNLPISNSLYAKSDEQIQENAQQNQLKIQNTKSSKIVYGKSQRSITKVSQSISQALIQSLSTATSIPKLETPKNNSGSIIQSNTTKNQPKTNATNATTIQNKTQKTSSNKTAQYSQTIKTTQNNLRKIDPPPAVDTTKKVQPQQAKVIKNRQFQGLGFYHDIPLTFRAGQNFQFHGVILNMNSINFGGAIRFNYINIVFSSWQDDSEFRCTQQIKDNKSLQFQVSCKIKSAGRYYLSIFPGSSGQTSAYPRLVVDQRSNVLPISAIYNGQTPLNLYLNISNNQLHLVWDSDANLSNITIYQKTKSSNKLTYLLSNNHKKFRIPYDDFFNFDDIETEVQLSHASSLDGTLYRISSKFSKTISLRFNATFHKFDEIATNLTKITPPIPWKLKVRQNLRFNATFGEDIKNQVYFISPNGIIQTINFVPDTAKPSTKIIKAGTPVSLSVSFSFPGTYLIQINAASGMALVNRPIYIGDTWPLLPDYMDLQNNAYSLSESPNSLIQAYLKKITSNVTQVEPLITASLDQKRAYLLHLLNGLRQMYKVGPVYLDKQLNEIAQAHSDDMVARDYFSHTDPEGRGPGERAAEMNFTLSIGQNIAQANTLAQIHLGLQRSADHLQNSVKNIWKRVGVGISINSYNQYVVAYSFSTRDLESNPLTSDQLNKQKQNFIAAMKQKYPKLIGQNPTLSPLIDSWMRTNRSTNLFNYIYSSGKYRGLMSYTSFIISYTDDWIKNVIDSNLVRMFPNYNQLSIGLNNHRQDINLLQGYIVFSSL